LASILMERTLTLTVALCIQGTYNAWCKKPGHSLVWHSTGMLTEQLGENDRVAIVVYAGAAGLVLPSITG
jgi:Ca-activated chloride channel homolog